jgi:Mn-dependent DtxR family transcriptional regulator
VTTLRASQIETLEAVANLSKPGRGVSAPFVAARLEISDYAAETRLIRLEMQGYIRSHVRRLAYPHYRLTAQGRSELSGGEKR